MDQITIGGRPFYFRNGTSDSLILSKLLPDGVPEYAWPSDVKPAVIWDLGANIGVISMQLAHVFPDATIYAVEPELENFRLLTINTEHMPNIKRFHMGLGASNETVTLYKSINPTNYGGYTHVIHDGIPACQFDKKTPEEFMYISESGQPDIIKMDVEGAEVEIIDSIPDQVLSSVKWIAGEMHGVDDGRVLARLQRFFDLKFEKRFGDPNWQFHGKNRSL